jgi:hypothetical protein
MNIADKIKPNTPWDKVVEAYGGEDKAIDEMSKYSGVDIRERTNLGVTPADVWEYEARDVVVPTLAEAYFPSASKVISKEGEFGQKILPTIGAGALDVANLIPRTISSFANEMGYGNKEQTSRQALAGGRKDVGGVVGLTNIVSQDPLIATTGGLASLGKSVAPKVVGALATSKLGKAVIPLAQKILPKAKAIPESSTLIKGSTHYNKVAQAGDNTRKALVAQATAQKGGTILGEGAVYEGQKALDEDRDITVGSLAKTTAENALATGIGQGLIKGGVQALKGASNMGKKAWSAVLKDERAGQVIVDWGLSDQSIGVISKDGKELFGASRNVDNMLNKVSQKYDKRLQELWGDQTVRGEAVLDDILAKVSAEANSAGSKLPVSVSPKEYVQRAQKIFDNASMPYKTDMSYIDPKTGSDIELFVLEDLSLRDLIDIRQRIKPLSMKIEGANTTDVDISSARILYDKLGDIIHKGDPKAVGYSSNMSDLIHTSEVVNEQVAKSATRNLLSGTSETTIANMPRKSFGTGTGAQGMDADRALTRQGLQILKTPVFANVATGTEKLVNPLGRTEAVADVIGGYTPQLTRLIRPLAKEGAKKVEEKIFGGDNKNSKLKAP